MISSNERSGLYNVYGCLNPGTEEPNLIPCFEARTGALVGELANGMAVNLKEIIDPKGFYDFFSLQGVQLDTISAELHALRIRDLLADPSDVIGLEKIVSYLVDDFSLLETWIAARMGSHYPLLLFGSYHVVPFFDEDKPYINALEYLRKFSEVFIPPFQRLLVKHDDSLFISKAFHGDNVHKLQDIIGRYPDYSLWVLSFKG